MVNEYNESIPEELIRKYRNLCNELGKEEELNNIPNSRIELIRKIGELNFEWIHDICMS